MVANERERHECIIEEVRQALKMAQDVPSTLKFSKMSHMMHSRRGFSKVGTRLPLLKRVVDFDDQGSAVWVEPDVTMEELVKATLHRGMIPAVVPEFKNITVGGAIVGTALESSSFAHGQFNDICEEYELLCDDGTLLRCTPRQHSDIFYGVVGSFGSLGRVTLAKVRLFPAKKYVRLQYHVVESVSEAVETLQQQCLAQPTSEFLEAMVISDDRVVVMSGRQTDEEHLVSGVQMVGLTAPWAPWFCQHVLQQAERQNAVDLIPLVDYLFRYDRAAFWMGQFTTSFHALWRYLLECCLSSPTLPRVFKNIFQQHGTSLQPNVFFRSLLAWKLSSKSLYRMLRKLPEDTFAKIFLVQDYYIPTAQVSTFYQFLKDNVHIYPLWLCPLRGTTALQILSPHFLKKKSQFPKPDFINVGVYGVPKDGKDVKEVTRELEILTDQLGGRKMLYGTNYYSENSFWKIYDRNIYQQLRRSCHVNDDHSPLYERIQSSKNYSP